MELSCRSNNSQICEARAQITTKTSMQRLSSNSINNKRKCSSSNKFSFSNRFKMGHLMALLFNGSLVRYLRPPLAHNRHLLRPLTLPSRATLPIVCKWPKPTSHPTRPHLIPLSLKMHPLQSHSMIGLSSF